MLDRQHTELIDFCYLINFLLLFKKSVTGQFVGAPTPLTENVFCNPHLRSFLFKGSVHPKKKNLFYFQKCLSVQTVFYLLRFGDVCHLAVTMEMNGIYFVSLKALKDYIKNKIKQQASARFTHNEPNRTHCQQLELLSELYRGVGRNLRDISRYTCRLVLDLELLYSPRCPSCFLCGFGAETSTV